MTDTSADLDTRKNNYIASELATIASKVCSLAISVASDHQDNILDMGNGRWDENNPYIPMYKKSVELNETLSMFIKTLLTADVDCNSIRYELEKLRTIDSLQSIRKPIYKLLDEL